MSTMEVINWTRRTLAIVIATLGIACPNNVVATEPLELRSPNQKSQLSWKSPEDVGGKELVWATYEQARSAESVQDYTEALLRGREINPKGLTKRNSAYLRKLMAWTFNKRGEVYSRLAGEFSENGQLVEAAENEGFAIRDFSASIRLEQTRWKPHYNRGISRALVGEFSKAEKDFDVVVQRRPQLKNAWFNRAEVHYEQQNYAQAEKDYSKVIAFQDGDIGAISSRGHTRFQLGRYEEALEDYETVVASEPESAPALTDRGTAYVQLRRWEEAATDFRAAMRFDNHYAPGYSNAAWMMATCPDERFRNENLALKAAERAIQLDGADNYRYLDALAAAHASVGHFDEACSAVTQAIHNAPQDAVLALEARLAQYKSEQPYRQAENDTSLER